MTSGQVGRSSAHRLERMIRLLAGVTLLIFFQAYIVAPLIPRLAARFAASGEKIGLALPAYMVPYGVSTLFYGLLSDRLGRRRIMLASLAAFVLTALTRHSSFRFGADSLAACHRIGSMWGCAAGACADR